MGNQWTKRDDLPVSPGGEELEDELNRRFAYHPPLTEVVKQQHGDMRSYAKIFARVVSKTCPPSRETSLALTKIEEAMMWANAAIARNQRQPEEG